MPKVSKATASQHYTVPGMMDAATAEVGGYTIDLQSWDIDMDWAFAYKGLPDDLCPNHHVAYVLKGKLTLTMADGTEEVFEAGDACVFTPGHVPAVTAGTEFVTFTRTEEARVTGPIVQANMAKYIAEQGIEVQVS